MITASRTRSIAGLTIKLAALATVAVLSATTGARAGSDHFYWWTLPNYFVWPAEPNDAAWIVAHERLVAKWRRSEPRCGWTVGGNTCTSRAVRRMEWR